MTNECPYCGSNDIETQDYEYDDIDDGFDKFLDIEKICQDCGTEFTVTWILASPKVEITKEGGEEYCEICDIYHNETHCPKCGRHVNLPTIGGYDPELDEG